MRKPYVPVPIQLGKGLTLIVFAFFDPKLVSLYLRLFPFQQDHPMTVRRGLHGIIRVSELPATPDKSLSERL